MEVIDASAHMSTELLEQLEAATTLLERTLGWHQERQHSLSGEVERIPATVEGSRREEELLVRLTEVQRELAELHAAAAAKSEGQDLSPKVLQALRCSLPSGLHP